MSTICVDIALAKCMVKERAAMKEEEEVLVLVLVLEAMVRRHVEKGEEADRPWQLIYPRIKQEEEHEKSICQGLLEGTLGMYVVGLRNRHREHGEVERER
jgi:predicted transcriptional regulator